MFEIVLPKCKDKKYPNSCAGYAFIQYKVRESAEKAINDSDLKEFKERKVILDWAKDKDTYVTAILEGSFLFKFYFSNNPKIEKILIYEL